MNKLQGLKAVLLSSPLLLTSAFAAEKAPAAEDLVGKFYGGAHLIYLNTDEDRVPADPLSASDPYVGEDHGTGFGVELGYRFTESVEARLSYSQINRNKNNSSFDKPYVADIAGLYFPTKQNFYVLGGLGYLDVGQEKESVNLGLGYREYFSDKFAVYLEAKGHYEFSGEYEDTSARLGVIYFFGGDEKSTPVRKKKPSMTAVAPIVASDTDNDGITDSNDRCPSTPATDKVDQNGCTIFTEETSRMSLLVNFDNNKSTVKAQYLSEIKKMSDFLTAYPEVSLVIEGHTSKVGRAAYNKVISQQRADAIVDVLVNQFNIDSDRLSAVGYGEENLLDSGDDKAAHAKNRRIEAKVAATKQVPVSR
jgi:OOP family OmpA-OmpF porin